MMDITIKENKDFYYAAYTETHFGIFTKYELGNLFYNADHDPDLSIVLCDSYEECLDFIVEQHNEFGGMLFDAQDIYRYLGPKVNMFYSFDDVNTYLEESME